MTHPTEVKLPESLDVVAVVSERGLSRLATGNAHCVHAYAKVVDEDDQRLVRLSDAESALKARDAEIERLRGALSAILSDSLDADSETNVPPALYAQGVAAIDQARAEGGDKTP